MLLWSIALVCLAIAAEICLGCGAFAGLTWLWLLPASFLGLFLLGLALAFFFLWAMCKRVDKSVPQEQDSPFYRRMATAYIDAIITLARVRIKTAGLEKTPKEGRFLLVCNHLSIADPVLLLWAFRHSQLAFISKKENDDMFLVGDVMHKLQCQLLDRENDRQALRVILKCISIIKEDKASVCVFPEGWCSTDFKLHRLRPGVFKIAQKANVPIAVCTVRNTQSVIPSLLKLKPSHVELRLVDVIPPEELTGLSTVEVSDRVYRLMADDLGEELVAEDT